MFDGIKNLAKNMALGPALNGLRDKFINPQLAGIGKINAMDWRDQKLHLTLTLEGLPDKPIAVECANIEISPDADSIRIGSFNASLPFAQNALDRFGHGPFSIPEGAARTALKAARPFLGI